MLSLPRPVCERVCDLMRFRSFKPQQELLSLVENSVFCCRGGTLSCWSSPSLASLGLLCWQDASLWHMDLGGLMARAPARSILEIPAVKTLS